MDEIHQCPKCKAKFTKLGSFNILIDEDLPDGIIRFVNSKGMRIDVPLADEDWIVLNLRED